MTLILEKPDETIDSKAEECEEEEEEEEEQYAVEFNLPVGVSKNWVELNQILSTIELLRNFISYYFTVSKSRQIRNIQINLTRGTIR